MEEEDIFEQYDEFGNYIGEDIIDQVKKDLNSHSKSIIGERSISDLRISQPNPI